ncbi:hypothetical protein LEP1GSC058_3326 [Leptospira fainei serovar Hurstbridge str. BUT 6]|uniref:Tic20-like protein n=1 Tax=Leptospira fainei serovar Hurstbridge str. BUT 6 TaxID=1193011 RepID=S3UYB0_9LEPT|nr:hypothetical protein [Leptospira fainei]EPG73354.1 hypothetical protein LEP1GSC058_3326 [Leptospira fainei serovar Hurstbridge str. BUT 6]
MKFERYSEKFAELKAKLLVLSKPYLNQAKEFLNSETFRVYLVTLPLFGNWLIGFTFYSKQAEVLRHSKLSFLNTLYFIGFVFLSWVLSWIPWAGSWLGNISHLAGICVYIGLSVFLLYNYSKGKKLVPKLPAEHLALLEQKLF